MENGARRRSNDLRAVVIGVDIAVYARDGIGVREEADGTRRISRRGVIHGPPAQLRHVTTLLTRPWVATTINLAHSVRSGSVPIPALVLPKRTSRIRKGDSA
jgi:hypothetical protein